MKNNEPASNGISEAMAMGEKLGMKVIVSPREMDISKFTINKVYQRAIHPAKIKSISESIKDSGVWPMVIYLNEKYEIIDGQHKYSSAKKLGIQKWLACVVTFPNKKKEAEFFYKINNWNNRLQPVDFWHSRFFAGCPYGLAIYELNDNPNSVLHNRISLRDRAISNSRLDIGSISYPINLLVLDTNHVWMVSRDKHQTEMVRAVGTEKIINGMNDFWGNFVFNWIGSEKKDASIAFRGESIRAIARFFYILKKESFWSSGHVNTAIINKMKMFSFTSDFARLSMSGKIVHICEHFNSSRRKRLDYSKYMA